jgi:3-hydroxyisobutyrate dehydrogenase-like beta-hydroxyacid dehydrogenase
MGPSTVTNPQITAAGKSTPDCVAEGDSVDQELAADGRRDVGLVGLGLMGSAMTGRLVAAGVTVVGYDPVEQAREAHLRNGGEVAASPAEVARRCPVVLLSLPNGQVSAEVLFGDAGVTAGAPDGLLVVDTSTIGPEEAESAAARLAVDGIGFCDAGISGSSNVVARGGSLGIVGGDASGFARAEPVLAAICREVMHVGGHGDGMRAKLVINAVLTINRFAVAEGLVLAEKMGMDSGQVLDVLAASIANSDALGIWGRRMVDRSYDPPASRIRQHNKDAQITLGLGRRYGAPLLVTAQINHVVQMALANGLGDADNSAVAEVLRMLAGADVTFRTPDGRRAYGAGGRTPPG